MTYDHLAKSFKLVLKECTHPDTFFLFFSTIFVFLNWFISLELYLELNFGHALRKKNWNDHLIGKLVVYLYIIFVNSVNILFFL